MLIFFVFVMLYRHAWKKRAMLNLTEKEELSLKYGQRAHLLSMGLGLVSLAIVLGEQRPGGDRRHDLRADGSAARLERLSVRQSARASSIMRTQGS